MTKASIEGCAEVRITSTSTSSKPSIRAENEDRRCEGRHHERKTRHLFSGLKCSSAGHIYTFGHPTCYPVPQAYRIGLLTEFTGNGHSRLESL